MKVNKKDLRKINEFLNQKIEKSKNFKIRFSRLMTKPTVYHAVRKHPNRNVIKSILKKEINNY